MPKQTRNAYFFFMRDVQKEYAARGQTIPMSEVSALAHPRWEQMTKEDRAPYEQRAKAEKAKKKQANAGRCDNQGNPLANRVDPQEEQKRRNAQEKTEIALMLKNQDETKVKFYLIGFTYYCVTSQGQRLLAEVGVLEYSLEGGIHRCFQRFLKPGKIPSGYRYTCIKQSQDVLNVPLDNFDKATDNYQQVWADLKTFTNPRNQNGTQPPLYCLSEDREEVEAGLQALGDLAARGEVVGRNALMVYKRVWGLDNLIHQLYLCRNPEPRSETQIISALKATTWDDSIEVRCEFHREHDGSLCALICPYKYCFTTSDMLAVVFDFELTDKHLPLEGLRAEMIVVIPPPPSRSVAAAAADPSLRFHGNKSLSQQSASAQAPGRSAVSQEAVFYSDEEDDNGDDDHEEEEEDSSSFRLPSAPARAMGLAPGQTAAPERPQGQDWPSLPRGIPMLAQAPPAAQAPMPPSAWQQPPQQAVPQPTPAASARGALPGKRGAPQRGREVRLQPRAPAPSSQETAALQTASLDRGLPGDRAARLGRGQTMDWNAGLGRGLTMDTPVGLEPGLMMDGSGGLGRGPTMDGYAGLGRGLTMDGSAGLGRDLAMDGSAGLGRGLTMDGYTGLGRGLTMDNSAGLGRGLTMEGTPGFGQGLVMDETVGLGQRLPLNGTAGLGRGLTMDGTAGLGRGLTRDAGAGDGQPLPAFRGHGPPSFPQQPRSAAPRGPRKGQGRGYMPLEVKMGVMGRGAQPSQRREVEERLPEALNQFSLDQ